MKNSTLLFWLILPIIIIVLFFATFKVDKTIVESTTIKTYTIVDIKRPKHFRVSLQDERGRIFQTVAVSKHCNRWREVKLGTVVQLPTSIMTKESGKERWIDIEARSICPGN